ncbi:hypothetical protein [Actinokineospora pegani]|uniref:hypothetical protein n=1 Tax=Actinokineospora pegani TaxID=2654637 RepID=UPI0018D3B524|nr:hypothetical protein [Actinokineospora pegani]
MKTSAMARQWTRAWPDALKAWGRFVTVHPPVLCESTKLARAEGLTGSFAMFRLTDRTVVLDLQAANDLNLGQHGVEVLAHEIGHHVLCPADLADGARLLARVRRCLPDLEQHAPLVANLYADALINDRLQRSRGLDMAGVYQRMPRGSASGLWSFYLRVFERLWALETGTLVDRVHTDTDTDAGLAARLVRVYATDWLAGAGGFAMLCYRYLAEAGEKEASALLARTCRAGLSAGDQVPGLTADDDGPLVHPVHDPRVNDFAPADVELDESGEQREKTTDAQFREPFEYGEILRQLGLAVSDEDMAARYYRERAAPHLVPFPVRRTPALLEPLPEGLENWDVGEPLERVDWLSTALRSPVVVPGVTTVQRHDGTMEGRESDPEPVDLDLYIDSSGSMPNPREAVSYLALAGAILALSALRMGARVQATLWSGKKQVLVTDGFVRDETAVLRVLTGYFGGATAFPLPTMRETYARPRRATHIVVISDEGVDTLFRGTDEQGRPGSDIAASALAGAGAGGTLLLHLFRPDRLATIAEMAPGWDAHAVGDWADLVAFAAAFSRRTYDRSKA